ncbi:glycosyltransferase family 2 protein [Candidatus Rhabdochlamydia sp. W815]|nr:glycosyltransferase family 2 protein [Candidatus Rhabdochlamydia sp. W815]
MLSQEKNGNIGATLKFSNFDMITVIILTKNSQETLEDTLFSVRGFPEILVYDTGSTDTTLDIAKQFPNVKIIQSEFIGFGPTRNKAAKSATHDWILALDSDEVLSSKLSQEILNISLDSNFIYQIDRHNFFNGKWIKSCGGWYPDPIIRLYHRKKTQFTDSMIHEKVSSQGMQIHPLFYPLFHTPYRNIHDFLKKMQVYSDLFATQKKDSKPVSLAKAIFHGSFAFFKSYFLKKGLKQGVEGFIISAYNGHTAFYKYLKLREAQKNQDIL